MVEWELLRTTSLQTLSTRTGYHFSACSFAPGNRASAQPRFFRAIRVSFSLPKKILNLFASVGLRLSPRHRILLVPSKLASASSMRLRVVPGLSVRWVLPSTLRRSITRLRATVASCWEAELDGLTDLDPVAIVFAPGDVAASLERPDRTALA